MKTARYILASPLYLLAVVMFILATAIDGEQHVESE